MSGIFEYTYTVQSGQAVAVRSGSALWRAQLTDLALRRPAVLCVVDSGVWSSHQAAIQSWADECANVRVHVVPAGEASKNRHEKQCIEDAAFAAGLGRDGLIIAIGGGMVGDLAGFAAATYMRGVAFVQVPTTIVSMVDSSIGGKTGIDVPQGKNLIGAFKHPVQIVTDLDWLASLPDREYRDGFAEVIKHGAILDEELIQYLEANVEAYRARDRAFLERVIPWNQKIKIDVVVADTEEKGQRKLLNFGHTLGHAIELLAKFELSHGVCVAAGMVLEARVGESLGISEYGTEARLRALLRAYGFEPGELVCPFPILSVIHATHTDKKKQGGHIHYVLLERVGTSAFAERGYSRAVADDDIRNIFS